jgi:hypothetical protein
MSGLTSTQKMDWLPYRIEFHEFITNGKNQILFITLEIDRSSILQTQNILTCERKNSIIFLIKWMRFKSFLFP